MSMDIHQYEKKFQRAINGIEKASISEKNKTLLLRYKDDCLLENNTKASLERVLYILKQMAELLDKDFDQCTLEEIKGLIAKIQDKHYSFWTVHTYRAILKKFYKWLNNGEYPIQVKWMKNNINKRS